MGVLRRTLSYVAPPVSSGRQINRIMKLQRTAKSSKTWLPAFRLRLAEESIDSSTKDHTAKQAAMKHVSVEPCEKTRADSTG